MRFDLERADVEYKASHSPLGSIEQMAAEVELEAQGIFSEQPLRPHLYDEAEEIYSAFGSLLEFSGGMEPVPIISYQAVSNWLDEHEIHRTSEREEARYLLRSMLQTQRMYRDENKPRN